MDRLSLSAGSGYAHRRRRTGSSSRAARTIDVTALDAGRHRRRFRNRRRRRRRGSQRLLSGYDDGGRCAGESRQLHPDGNTIDGNTVVSVDLDGARRRRRLLRSLRAPGRQRRSERPDRPGQSDSRHRRRSCSRSEPADHGQYRRRWLCSGHAAGNRRRDPRLVRPRYAGRIRHRSAPGYRQERLAGASFSVGPSPEAHHNTVEYTALDERSADGCIEAVVARFAALKHGIEWKVHAHDRPADLGARLLAKGFEQGGRETLMVRPVGDGRHAGIARRHRHPPRHRSGGSGRPGGGGDRGLERRQ